MKNIVLLVLFLMLAGSTYSQNNAGDSLAVGRVCKIVLYNGFQTEGKIASRSSDTLILATEYTNLRIPVNSIKFVLNSDVELSDYLDGDSSNNIGMLESNVKQEISEECDIYVENMKRISDVNVYLQSDTTICAVKNGKTSKVYHISGLRRIVFSASSPFGKGFWIGGAITAGIGLGIVYLLSMGEAEVIHYLLFGALTALPGAVIGGTLGEFFSGYDVYSFNEGITDSKLKKLKFIISKHHK